MGADSGSGESSLGKLFLPALALASFSTGPIGVLAALLLIDIGDTFGTTVGVTSQINTSYSIAAVVFALLASVLSLKLRSKSLLLAGISLMVVSVLGCYFAPDFAMLFVFFSISGAGYALVNPMTFALVGEHFPVEKRSGAIGLVVASGALVYVVGAPVIALMAGFGGWRFPLSGFVLPILLASLLMGFVGLPSASQNRNALSNSETPSGFKEIFMSKSAVACLVGDTFRSAAFVAVLFYSTSFFRERFSLPTDLASLILLSGALSYVVGSLTAGQLVKRLGRKPATVLTALLSGIFTVAYVFVPVIEISIALMLAAAWFFGMLASSANSLTLEQIPNHRGPMMSMDTAVINVGSAVGSAIGGLALLHFGYEGLASALGAIGIVSAIVFSLLAKDPTTK